MAKQAKKPGPSMTEKKKRVRKAVGILGDALDDYDAKHPH
jgi:hypothetical protein